MRVFIICLFVVSSCASTGNAQGYKNSNPVPPFKAPSSQDVLKNFKYEPPNAKSKLPELSTQPPVYESTPDETPDNFGRWWIARTIYGCKLEQVAEKQGGFFLWSKSHITYWFTGEDANKFIIYVPSQPKGIPVAQVDSRTFRLSPQKAQNFVPQTHDDMLKAMKLGTVMFVEWVDGEGGRHQDRYSLTGFAQGLAVEQCP